MIETSDANGGSICGKMIGDVASLFTRSDGKYVFARWGRPIVPVVFGVDDATLAVFKGAIEAVITLASHQIAETDPELGANFMVFFCRDWAELQEVSHLDQMNHSAPFWAVVARLYPDYDAPRRWLRAHGAELHRIVLDARAAV